MKRFFIITNSYKDENALFARRIQDYICQKGGRCAYLTTADAPESFDPIGEQIEQDTEAVIVLGGDGTLIRAAKRLVRLDLPMIGVNLGHVGYLCELDRENVYEAVDAMLRDEYLIENRMRLTAGTNEALNDIVIHRTGVLQMVNLTVYVNGEYLHSFDGDGVIVSSPTGSTAYNLSAGGPIVDPKAQAILITPINAHNVSSKSIVLDAADEVVIEIGSRRREQDETVMVSFDGDQNITLAAGERICIRRSERDARIIRLSKVSFLEILRRKLN